MQMSLARWFGTLLALVPAIGLADGDVDAQIKRVESALNRIQMEQQTVFQQFQMVQELGRQELQRIEQSVLMYQPSAQPRNYDDVVREQQAYEDRRRRYADEAERLYARYRELEEQKRPLLDRLNELAQER
jgi:chromosome segregation ATPase